jgi:hypothetical protein
LKIIKMLKFTNYNLLIIQPMTFLQQTLGKNYKWWYIVKYNVKLAGSSYFMNIMEFFGNIVFTLALMFLWNLKQPNQEIFTYLLFGTYQ